MRTISPARFLLASTAAAGAVALAAAMPAASAASASWHTAFKVSGSGFPEFSAVTATSASSAWAFEVAGSKAPVAYQLSGSVWKSRPFPAKSGDFVTAAASSSASNVWAFTFKGQVLRFNGSSWTAVHKFSKPINSGVVLSSTDVWIFGSPGTGTYHYNGHTWTHSTSGRGLNGGSALSASSIWAYGGTSVAHWNGSRWTKANLARLLPKNTQLSHSHLSGIYAATARNVYAIASGGRQDEGGPLVLLHYNGHVWSRVAENKSLGDPIAVIGDGSGGLWIPVRTGFPGNGSMERYSHGTLSSVKLPFSPAHLLLLGAAIGKHTTAALAVGLMRKSFNAKTSTAVILRYGR
jgi:hypothetical protein